MTLKIDTKFWIGIGISLFFMALLLRKIDFHQLGTALMTVNVRYILLAILATFASYFMRAVRWRYLLITEKKISLSSLYPATVIGYMANNLLPARLGEFVRAYVLAEREKLAVPSVFASLVIDRLFDGFTVMLILAATLLMLKFPPAMAEAEGALRTGGIVMFVSYTLVVMFLILLKRQTVRTLAMTALLLKPFPRSFSERLIPLLGSFISGIRISSRGGHLVALLGSSLVIWMFCVIGVDLTLRGFGIDLPISASMFILVLLVFAVMVPASPGFIGTYHYACYQGLSAFGVEKSTAVSIALVMHGTGFFPVILAGCYYLWKTKISLRAVGKTAGEGA